MVAREHRVAARLLAAVDEVAEHVHDLPGERAVEHRDVDELAAAGLVPAARAAGCQPPP